MAPTVVSPLAAWESFYVIVGSSAAGLTGLMFVVVALIAEARIDRSHENVSAFGTPTVVHFCFVLLVACILSAPWHTLVSPALALGMIGSAGLAYVAIVTFRARRASYQPVLEDWVFHVILPIVAYGAVVASAIELPPRPEDALFGIAAALLILLAVGIHNAWDTVTYIAIRIPPPGSGSGGET